MGFERYHLEEADVLSEGSDASAEGDEEHDHAHHDEDDGWVDEERVPHRVCQGERGERHSSCLHIGLGLHISPGFSSHIRLSSEDCPNHRSGITGASPKG